MPDAPLILTLKLDTDSQQYFNAQRRENFPPERNFLDAHLTLFHSLPPSVTQITEDIKLATHTYGVMDLQVTGIVSIGNGIAYTIHCPLLIQLHGYLQAQWSQWLTEQDKQKLWPHITIQNKVDAEQASLLKAQLELDFKPFNVVAKGLLLYEYKGGPWGFIREFEFEGNPPA